VKSLEIGTCRKKVSTDGEGGLTQWGLNLLTQISTQEVSYSQTDRDIHGKVW